ncbi:uncharacterized protein I303_106762 [Kwoniella dejecticola CBS 10117]|uniref:Pre-rRNA-processing protein IPI3 n=1 Tax=Kwoniella dejecticola CBS 10117 TaxID=1296121 RepID=A0A1A5ZTS4_9TREE|nr:pre-rRNA-processing protein IPI3 [Kwoniella dejecticola CBS 10117]OBR81211.1 pre-rRNA-processing protein IPI3 [Kwoniella dejecticola CBS 10117]
MAPQELILSACSSDPSSSSGRQISTPSIHLHDLLTSGSVQSFKNSASSSHSLGYVQSQNGQGAGVFAVQEGKGILNVWAWQKDQMHTKIHLPEKMSCFTVSPNGLWAVAGSPNGQIYLWELASGLLLSSFTTHYRSLTSLTFTPDSQILISTSLDSSTHIFLVSRLIDPEDPATAGKPYGSLTDHTLAVRAVGLGKLAGSMGGRIWTCSDDGTVKMWSLHPPFALLCTFTLPSGSSPNNLAIDPMERFFYVSTSQGLVYHIPLFRRKGLPDSASADESYEAVGGSVNGHGSIPLKVEGAVISTSTSASTSTSESKVKISITSMTLSISSTTLLIGCSDGTIHLYSLPSHQHLRTLSSHSGPITHLSTLLKPVDLLISGGGSSSSGGVKGKVLEEYPIMEIKNFERMKSQNVKTNHNITIKLPQHHHNATTNSTSSLLSQLDDLRPKRAQSIGVGAQTQGVEQAQLESLLEENKRLKSSLERASQINEKMWNGIIDMKLTTSNGD